MRRLKLSMTMLLMPMAVAMMIGLAGCGGVYVDGGGPGYYDGGPEWDGGLVVVGGDGRDHRDDRHDNVFHAGGRDHDADRGRSSLGGRVGGGFHGGGGGHGGGGHR